MLEFTQFALACEPKHAGPSTQELMFLISKAILPNIHRESSRLTNVAEREKEKLNEFHLYQETLAVRAAIATTWNGYGRRCAYIRYQIGQIER